MFNGMNFKSFTLDNQLQVLAISDPRFVKSSAALSVMAGSMQNPDEHLGLAHFLEHMLFLGTEAYPEVGAYEDFLNKNGGGHNAYTSIDHTNYFFDVAHSGFEGALDRFSRFFVCPTFDDQYVDREKNAVHSEHEKNRKDDSRREYRFLQMITDPEHPFSKFATGDKETLAAANRDVVMKFYKDKYSANLMRLVLMSPLPEDQLMSLAQQYFQDVPNKEAEAPVFSDQLFVDNKPQIHRVESIRDRDFLKMSFDLPDDIPYWKSKPTQFLAHLLGEEGEGSVLSYLKSEGLALGLETSTWWRMFHIKVRLTEKGKKQHESVIETLFSAIELFKKEGLKDYIYKEREVLAKTELSYIEPKSSMGRASQYSASMLYYPVESFLQQYYLYHEHSQADFDRFIERLNVDNMQITLMSNESVAEGKQEPFYGIGFRSDDLDPAFLEKLRKPESIPSIFYPKPNAFLPDQLKLIAEPGLYPAKEEVYKQFTTLYSQVDTELKIPKASISLSFISDKISGNPKNYLIAKLFAKLKQEELNEWGYPIRLAGMNYGISHGYNTMTLDVNGYSQHLVSLLKKLIVDKENDRIINEVAVDGERFQSIKAKLKKDLENREFDAAYQRLLFENSHFFSTASIHFEDYQELVDDIEMEDINEFAKDFFSQLAMRVFCYGNIDADSVKPVIDLVFSSLSPKGLTEKDVEVFENKFIKLPNKALAYELHGQNNNNAQVSFYQASSWSFESQAYMDVLSKIVEQPFFTELRTHQQLGYIVAAFTTSSHGYCGIGTLVQSQTHGAVDIYERSDRFLKDFLTQVQSALADADLEVIKAALLTELLQMPNSLGERLSRFTMMAGTYHGDFQFFDKLAEQIKKVSAHSLGRFIEESLLAKQFRPQLSFFYKGQGLENENLPESLEKIESYKELMGQLEKHQPYKNSKKLS